MGFNPRTPCGVRPVFWLSERGNQSFQSTHSLRSATLAQRMGAFHIPVSIHALLAECDCSGSAWGWLLSCFNPRTPCGVRPESSVTRMRFRRFQSTHSLRSATRLYAVLLPFNAVSIHALLAECDFGKCLGIQDHTCFNPRTPCGVRHGHYSDGNSYGWFQSTHSLRSATFFAGSRQVI